MKAAILALVGCLVAASSWAPGQTIRPRAASRDVHTWTFDDALSRIEPVPPGWFRAQDNPTGRERPGFPTWNVPITSGDAARSGTRSVALPTRGGSTSLMLSAGASPALPDADYLIRAHVRTAGLTHARAALRAWILDENLTRIDSTYASSELVVSEDDWTEIAADVRGDVRGAWLQIELALLQPKEFVPQRHAHQVWSEDYAGAAYFDDIVISQVPRIHLRADAPGNVFVSPADPVLAVSVRDMTGEPLSVTLEVRDLDGKLVDARSMPAPENERQAFWSPALPRYGWYAAKMEIQSDTGEAMGSRRLDFIWAPDLPAPDAGARQNFGVAAENLRAEFRKTLEVMLPRLFTGSVRLAPFAPGDTLGSRESVDSLHREAERLLSLGLDLTFVITNLPADLTRELRIDRDDPIPLFLAPNDPWSPMLSHTLSVFGERVRRWQLGSTGSDAPSGRRELASELETIRKKLRTRIPRPRLALPWNIQLDPSHADAAADALTISWPIGIAPGEIMRLPARPADSTSTGPERTLHIERLPEHTFSKRDAIIELARRVTAARAAGYERLSIDGPWTEPAHTDESLSPSADAAAWRTLSAFLASSRIIGVLPAPAGVVAYIARSDRGGLIICWNESAEPSEALIEGWLGEGNVTAYDPFGNSTLVERDEHRTHRYLVGEMPTIITGVDADLALFRSRVRIDPPFIASRAERHEVKIAIENPWPVGVTGRIRIAEPVEWTIAPRVISFTLPAGGSSNVPIEVAFAPGQEAGVQKLIAEVELVAERRYPVVRWPIAIELGLPTIELFPSYRLEQRDAASPADLVVSLLITNTGESPLTIEAFARAPGYRAYEAPISGVEPGTSVVRRFRFEGGGETLLGRAVRVGLRETSGTGRINRTLTIE